MLILKIQKSGTILVNAITMNADLSRRLERTISSWNKIRRVIAMVLRFKKTITREVISKKI